MVRFSVIIAMVVGLCTMDAVAQTSARVTTIHAVKGTATARFTLAVHCDGVAQSLLSNSQLAVIDNGTPVDDFRIVESFSPALPNPISAVLVLDASGSMIGAAHDSTKMAAHAFISLMDGSSDEAALIQFNTTVQHAQPMTTDTSLLHAAVDSLTAQGATALWDATYEGLLELQSAAVNQKRAVVVLTDGGDNMSTHTTTSIIGLAQTHNLRVFTIALGPAPNTTELQLVAQLTGGAYFFALRPADLLTIFTQIATFMGRGFEEHTIEFTSPEPDASLHVLEVSVVACGSSVSSTFQEPALTLTGTHPPPAAMPHTLELGQSIPNPTPGDAVIPFTLSGVDTPQSVRLEVYDLLGRRVAMLVDGEVLPGSHQARFHAGELAPGLYLYRLSTGGMSSTKTLIVC